MDEKKLGTESAYPAIGWKYLGDGKIVSVPDTPGMSKRLFIAMNFATVFAQEYFKFEKDNNLKYMKPRFRNPTGIIETAYEFADELLKQENSG